MKLSEIFEYSKGKLSHAERDFYLAICSFADNETGECFPRMKTVADRAGVPQSSATRLVQKLIKLKFILKSKDGFLCLIGYKQTSQESKFSSQESKSETSQESNYNSQQSKQTSQESKSFNNNYPLTRKEEEKTTAPTALEIYREFFPSYQLTEYQENLLTQTEIVETDFRQTMKFWAGKGHRENNIFGLLDCYRNGSWKPKQEAKPKDDDSGLYKTVEQMKAERENTVINIPKREVRNA